MKYLIKDSDYICTLIDSNQEGFLRGFLEKEPELFKFTDGFLFQFFEYPDVRFMPWNNLQLNLENLNRIINDLTTKQYHQKDQLIKSQINAIVQNLYSQCIVKSVELEGFTTKQANIIISKSYEDGHSGGYGDVICHCWDLISFINNYENTK